MSLTAEQLAHREGRLTASRVKVLMTGDKAGIMQLYREMIGEQPEENLDNVWPVQLGHVTEKLNLDWYEKKCGYLLTHRGTVTVHPDFDWAAATLDGWDPQLNCPIECKHNNGFEPWEILVDRFQPQMQWQMWCTGATKCGLNVICGAREPVVDYIEMHDGYQTQMVDRAEYFMMCVDLRQPPVDISQPVISPADAVKVYDMTGNNAWAQSAANWLASKDAAELFDIAKDALKELMPPDAKRAVGYGVYILRDRAGRLHVRKD